MYQLQHGEGSDLISLGKIDDHASANDEDHVCFCNLPVVKAKKEPTAGGWWLHGVKDDPINTRKYL